MKVLVWKPACRLGVADKNIEATPHQGARRPYL
jgi:hypothetical protein